MSAPTSTAAPAPTTSTPPAGTVGDALPAWIVGDDRGGVTPIEDLLARVEVPIVVPAHLAGWESPEADGPARLRVTEAGGWQLGWTGEGESGASFFAQLGTDLVIDLDPVRDVGERIRIGDDGSALLEGEPEFCNAPRPGEEGTTRPHGAWWWVDRATGVELELVVAWDAVDCDRAPFTVDDVLSMVASTSVAFDPRPGATCHHPSGLRYRAPLGYEFVARDVFPESPPCKFVVRSGQPLRDDGRLDDPGLPIVIEHFDARSRPAAEDMLWEAAAALAGIHERRDVADLPLLTADELAMRLESGTATVARLERDRRLGLPGPIAIAGPSADRAEEGDDEPVLSIVTILPNRQVVSAFVSPVAGFDYLTDARTLMTMMQTAEHRPVVDPLGAPDPSAPSLDDATLDVRGIGPLHVGASVQEITALGYRVEDGDCGIPFVRFGTDGAVALRGGPTGDPAPGDTVTCLYFWFDAWNWGVRTDAGVGAGSTRADVIAAYGDRVVERTVEVEDYDPTVQTFESRLELVPDDDPDRRMIFSFDDDGVLLGIRTGETDAIREPFLCA